jgi:Ca-activated chloride channel family protein
VGKQALDAAASSPGAPPVGPSVAREQQFDAYRLPHGGALPPLVSPPAADRERYAALRDNGVVATAQNPFSTFSIDVDTGSYANVRRFLNAGRLPPPDAVRVEEMVNYFPYHYAEPPGAGGSRAPFGFTTEVAATPWNPDTLLLRIGIKAFDAPRASLPPCNLVFLVDVSGSMNAPNKLPLLKNALRLMVDGLRPQDRVALVTYASGTRVVLPPTSGTDKATIRLAIDQLVPGGSTAGAAGIQLAYQMAQQGFLRDGINRILLATDGDFNVGITDFAQLKGMVEEKRRSGVSLSTLGFGEGNYREDLMEQLADAGDGNYSYIDTLNEAHKVLVEEASSTLSIVARDVKIQVEFNPAVVTEYRLIGYENRALAREDFRNDRVDAGEIGAGHTVTALYELVPVGKPGLLGESRYSLSQTPSPSTPAQVAEGTRHADEIGMLRLRYKSPSGGASQELAAPIANTVREAGEDLRFAAAVAAFGQELRGGRYLGDFAYARIAALADGARGRDPFGYRGEFVRLVKLAGALATRPVVGSAPAN